MDLHSVTYDDPHTQFHEIVADLLGKWRASIQLRRRRQGRRLDSFSAMRQLTRYLSDFSLGRLSGSRAQACAKHKTFIDLQKARHENVPR